MVDDTVTGKAIGGKARANRLTPERRREIAQKAATARWQAPKEDEPTRATHEGELLMGDSSIPCAVLEDGTRVFTQRGIFRVLGLSATTGSVRGNVGVAQVPRFMASASLTPYISEGLRRASTPVIFIPCHGGRTAYGYAAEILPEICNAYLEARRAGALKRNQLPIADKCELLVLGFSKVGIIALIDEATGYQETRPKDALQAYLTIIIRKELAAWAKKFPDEFYENIYKLNGWPWPGMKKNRYSVVAQYTRDLVYERLAPGLLEELEKKSPKDEKGNRENKLHQWLTEDVGNPMLAQHLHALMMFQRLAISQGYGWKRFVRMVDKVLPKRGSNFEFPFADPDPIVP